jgi:hypothetical protein
MENFTEVRSGVEGADVYCWNYSPVMEETGTDTSAPSTPDLTSVKFSIPLMMSYGNMPNPYPNITKFPMMRGLLPHFHLT